MPMLPIKGDEAPQRSRPLLLCLDVLLVEVGRAFRRPELKRGLVSSDAEIPGG